MGISNADERKKSYEYINEFLYFVIRPDENRGNGALTYCSGVNLFRFLPITKKRHGLASNPALRGLQLVNLDIWIMGQSKGIAMKHIRGNDCAGISPTNEGWYTELLLIEHAPDTFPEEVIRYGVANLLKKITTCLLQEVPLPDTLLEPDELQAFIEDLCTKHDW